MNHPTARNGPRIRKNSGLPRRRWDISRLPQHIRTFAGLAACLLALGFPRAAAEKPTAAQRDFFEARIRPVLIEQCYSCHNSADTAEGDLALDHRQAVLDGGHGGPIVVPGQPDDSRLIAILRHEIDGLEMPQDGPQLNDRVIADFEQWIRMGAPDPRDEPPSSDEVKAATSWDAKFERRKQWWSFQPIRNSNPPAVAETSHPVDRFIRHTLADRHLPTAAPAEPHVLVRRLYFALTGLPPTAEESVAWTKRIAETPAAERDVAVEQIIDELLSRPQFGERWARHWMDWIRYAESHGSEGDPAIDNAWMFRDYLIRALNDDVPVDQLIREHIAGDLLEEPRVDAERKMNESAIGPAHWRMVFHGFAPTDALEERVRFTDDQINAFSRAFLGLTVSCARCHDHKFDAISQADYYALYGILAACRPGRTVIDLPETRGRHRDALRKLKNEIRTAICRDWSSSLNELSAVVTRTAKNSEELPSILRPIAEIKTQMAAGLSFDDAWQQQVNAFDRQRIRWKQRADNAVRRWVLNDPDGYAAWYPAGTGLPSTPQPAGTFAVALNTEQALEGVYPSGIYSHNLSMKDAARLTSRDFPVGPNQELRLLAIGAYGASVRFVVHDYPRNGTVFPVHSLTNQWTWRQFDSLSYWEGDEAHIELSTPRDAPLLVHQQDQAWFGIREAVIVHKGTDLPNDDFEALVPLFERAANDPPASPDDLGTLYSKTIADAVQRWKTGNITDEQAILLDECLRSQQLPNDVGELPTAAPLLTEYRRLDAEIPVPTRVPGLEESAAHNQPLFTRGDHRLPAETVPRRFLEAIDGTPYPNDGHQSGRLELAEDLLRDDNPLTRRVLVNRIWHHLFGHGIVRSPDNFGRLGEQPTHPELLDWLAARFTRDGWSLKKTVRLLVTSRTWQQSSHPSTDARDSDPENRLLSHANVRRLEAEAVRDAILLASGQLDQSLAGPPVEGTSKRRSIYVQVIRNSLDPFLRAFDFPEPFTCTGRRDTTNVPAQSLTLMNDPAVIQAARQWAQRTLEIRSTRTDRIQFLFQSAFGRAATETDLQRAAAHLSATERDRQTRIDRAPSSPDEHNDGSEASFEIDVWADFAQALLISKEFIYLR